MPGLDPNSNSDRREVPCRTCTDFKSWAKKQNTMFSSDAGDQNTGSSNKTVKKDAVEINNNHGCPYDKDDLGRSTWGLLHTMAANYPDQPNNEQMNNISTFFSIFAKVYPCDTCAKDFQKELVSEPIQASTQQSFAQWLCRMHNKVNVKLGKPLFDCALVNERWRDGWKDGSCD